MQRVEKYIYLSALINLPIDVTGKEISLGNY